MRAATVTEEDLIAVPLHHAVFCADCETISNSPHDECTICGSHALISLFRTLGTLRNQPPSPEANANLSKYDLELTAKIGEIPATELNRIIEFITSLAKVCGDLQRLHFHVESVTDGQGVFRAA